VEDEPPQPAIATATSTVTVDITSLRRFVATNIRLKVPIANADAVSPMLDGKLGAGTDRAFPEAVVDTVAVTDVAALPVTFTEAGRLQIGAGLAAGATLQVRLTVPLNDPVGVIVKPNVAAWPAVIVDELDPPEAMPMVKSGVEEAVPETTTT
jgi:hypothetical protein